MRILVSGSSGLVGSELVKSLETQGHEVHRLIRNGKEQNKRVVWNPMTGDVDLNRISGFDAVVHLAGESIAQGRWNQQKKSRILDSRAAPTHRLARVLSQVNNPPKVFISASAIGYYGNRGDEILTEKSSPGRDFLALVCQKWEEATLPLKEKGVRVVSLRFGIVLSPSGGALGSLLPPFKMGVGGTIGNGNQFMSWVALEDAVGIIQHVLKDDKLEGAVNAVAPTPVTNYEFTKTLGKVLSRRTIFPMPAFAARLIFGEMADALLLSSIRVAPKRLLESGYKFRFTNLESALKTLLAR